MDSATIVSAALDSRQLEDSINKLVATVANKTKEMADNIKTEEFIFTDSGSYGASRQEYWQHQN